MMLVYPEIQQEFEFSNSHVNSLVIENRGLFLRFMEDIHAQINGFDGKAVLSEKFVPISIAKRLELIYDFIGLEINRKALLNKAVAIIEKTALDEEHYLVVQKLLSQIQSFIKECSFNLQCNIIADKLSINSMLKAAGVAFADDYGGVKGYAEKLIDYMETVRELECDKLFVTVNMRSFFDDETVESLCETVMKHELKLLMVENKEYDMMRCEHRVIVDSDLCEIIKPIDNLIGFQ